MSLSGRYLPLVRHVVAHAEMDVSELLAALSAALPSSGEAIGPGAGSGLDARGAIKLGEDPMPSLAWLLGMSLLRVVRVAVHVHPLHRIREAVMTLLRSLSHHSCDPDVREASGYGPIPLTLPHSDRLEPCDVTRATIMAELPVPYRAKCRRYAILVAHLPQSQLRLLNGELRVGNDTSSEKQSSPTSERADSDVDSAKPHLHLYRCVNCLFF